MANKKENLKPFQKGEDSRRNKNGRPKKPNINELMDEILGEDKNNIAAAKAIVLAIRNKALKGDLPSAKWIFEYAYGLPKQKIENVVTDEDGNETPAMPTIVFMNTTNKT